MRSDKPTPMTEAERQRKHRLKRQRELQALRAVVPATPQERESVAQVQRLAAQLDKATRAAAALQARVHALDAANGNSERVTGPARGCAHFAAKAHPGRAAGGAQASGGLRGGAVASTRGTATACGRAAFNPFFPRVF